MNSRTIIMQLIHMANIKFQIRPWNNIIVWACYISHAAFCPAATEDNWIFTWDLPQVVRHWAFIFGLFHRHYMTISWHGHNFRITSPCAGNSPVTGWVPTRRPSGSGICSFDVFFVVNLKNPLYKQLIAMDFTRHHCNDYPGKYGTYTIS